MPKTKSTNMFLATFHIILAKISGINSNVEYSFTKRSLDNFFDKYEKNVGSSFPSNFDQIQLGFNSLTLFTNKLLQNFDKIPMTGK